MTAVWGPMGWITLHSISVNYPEHPKADDKAILKKFLELFIETISCPTCKGHFGSMYKSYTVQNPYWADSRYNLFLFVVRAHNTVNKRIDKPRPSTVAECLTSLRMAPELKKPADYRASYISYLIGNWVKEGGGEGMIQVGHAKEMRKINQEYWNLRETGFSVVFPEADILQPIAASPRFITPYSQIAIYSKPNISIGFKLKGGKFSFGSR